ncbi:MAG: hypothetical protein ACOC1F_11580 [Myxococcota bacterium]
MWSTICGRRDPLRVVAVSALGVLGACAPIETIHTQTPVSGRSWTVSEEPDQGRATFRVSGSREAGQLKVHIEPAGICETREVREIVISETVEKRPSVAVLIVEVAVAAVGGAILYAGYRMHREEERTGDGDDSHDWGEPTMLGGGMLLTGGTFAAIVDINTADTKTDTRTVRRETSGVSPCGVAALDGMAVHLVGEGVRLSSAIDGRGRAHFPAFGNGRERLSFDVFLERDFIGTVSFEAVFR